MHEPILPQRLGASEDFFHHHVNSAPILRQGDRQRLRATLLKFFEVLAGQIETIWMIDAETGHSAGIYQLQ